VPLAWAEEEGNREDILINVYYIIICKRHQRYLQHQYDTRV